MESATFPEIRENKVARGTWFEPTVLTIVRHDSTEFVLALSTEGRRDQLFIGVLEDSLR